MSDLEQRLAEDRALRDTALALFKADLTFVRSDIREKGVGARLAERLGEGTRDMVDDAVDYAGANSAKVTAAALAAILWFARKPIANLASRLFGEDQDDEEPAGAGGRSEDECSGWERIER